MTDTTPTEIPEEPKPSERIGLRGHEDDPADYDAKQLPLAAPDIDPGAEATIRTPEYLDPDSTRPASL